jgi:hypothetical protein
MLGTYLGTPGVGWIPAPQRTGAPVSTGLAMLAGVCGQAGGPVNGSSIWQRNELIGASNIYTVIINNIPNWTFGPNESIVFNPGTGEIDWSPNTFFTDDTIMLWYTPA